MSDYMFMLESHLSTEQFRVVGEMQKLAAGSNLFLTGGALRDMIGGFPVRDLDFTVEANPLKLAKAIEKAGAKITGADDLRKCLELEFPPGVTASIGMAHSEKFAKSGGKPQVSPATIHEDLLRRDFTVNAIALSLGKASRGLLLDPTNGLGDLSRRELRAVSNYTLYDDPSRILRMIRLRVRLGFTIEDRTLAQYRNVREASLDAKIPPSAWQHELEQIATDPLAGDILRALEEEGLIQHLSPALAGPKLNLTGFQRLHKARQSVPFGIDLDANMHDLYLFLLLEKLTPRERSQLMHTVEFRKEHLDAASRLEARAAKVEKQLATAKLTRPSALYALLHKVPGEILLFLLARSGQRLVLDRIKNYLQKYLPASQEITDQDVIEKGGVPGTPKFQKLKEELIATRLDAKPKKVVIEEPPPTPPPSGPGRRSISIGR